MIARQTLRRFLPVAAGLLLGVVLIGSASAQVPAVGIDTKNVHSEGNLLNLGGNSLDFFERRQPDGSVKRYAVAAAHGNGFDIVDVTSPLDPRTVGRFASPGVNYHPWVQVNPRRNIVAISIEEPGFTLQHGGSNGIEFVDITNVASPTRLGSVSGVGGPHTIRMIGNNHIYTTMPTNIIDYANPSNPVNLGPKSVPGLGLLCGHEFYPDPNMQSRTYVGFCSAVGDGKWGVIDTTNPANPTLIVEHRDRTIELAHEAFPSPDSSYVAVGDFRGGGQTHVKCPGGGIHFYDISGKYVPGASLTAPKKMGVWFAPFSGKAPVDPTTVNGNLPNWGSCTLHSFQFQPERNLLVAGLYTGGTWVADPSAATTTGGAYAEYAGNSNLALGPTTWGNTKGHFIAEGDFVNASQWLPFDIPVAKDHYYANGLIRGLDVFHFAGSMPKKLSRLSVNGSASGGIVRGVLDRYAVLTFEGWVNKPLAGKTVEIRSGGTTLTATTAADGSFSTNLGLAPGAHQVTVSWAGDQEFETVSVTRQVTA